MKEETTNEILVVDDNPENLKVLGSLLKEENYKVRYAKSGLQALDTIAESLPDLVLLDINMPAMDGFEVCKRIKNDPASQFLPVIFISALGDSFNKKIGFESGAVDYLTKPFDGDEVKARIRLHLQLRAGLREIESLRQELAEKDLLIRQLKKPQ